MVVELWNKKQAKRKKGKPERGGVSPSTKRGRERELEVPRAE